MSSKSGSSGIHPEFFGSAKKRKVQRQTTIMPEVF